MQGTSVAGSHVRAFVAWTLRHGLLLWSIAILIGVFAAARTVSLYQHLKSDIEELLPRESPSVRALDEMRRRLLGLEYLGVVVDVGRSENLSAGERFLDDLAARIRTYPSDMVREVRTGSDAERKLIESHAPLYMDLADLSEVLRRIESRRDYEVEKESGALLDDSDPPPPVDISDIEKKYDKKLSDKKVGGARFSDSTQHITLLFVEAGAFTTGAEKARALLDRVRSDVGALGGTARYAPGMRVGYSSDVAISVEELDALEADLSISSLVVVALEVLVIVLYYRWWRSLVVLFPPLLLAAVYAFGLASLPPANIKELNSNTAFLGSIILGNGINVGIVLLARYREARRAGASVEQATVTAVGGTRLGTMAAAFAAAVSYASLILTEFRGFRQFGFIGAAGMVASWITAFVLIPPLLHWVDRDEIRPPSTGASKTTGPTTIMGRVARLVERWPVPIVAVAVALTVGSVFVVSRFDPANQLEHDFSQLRRSDTWLSGDGYWGRKVDGLLGRYLTPTVVLSDSTGASSAAEHDIRESVENGALGPMVASVRGATDVLPGDQESKLRVTRDIREALTPKIRSLLDDHARKKLDDFLGPVDLAPLRVEDLPRSFAAGLREVDGSVGRTVLVYPRPSDTLWKAAAIHSFVRALRATGGRVAGSIPLSDDILASIGRDAPIASLASLLGVVAIVLVVLWGRAAALYVIGSLIVGVLWMAAATMLLHIKVNFCNFVAYPITFGIGVDYAVNVMTRYVQDGERDVTGAIRSTGAAVGLCSLTTIIGYCSLLLAKNRALYLFGLTSVLGEVACLVAAVVALPALLVAVRRPKRPLANRGRLVPQRTDAPAIDVAAAHSDPADASGL
jgi:predicted RND superfamily exporter protein